MMSNEAVHFDQVIPRLEETLHSMAKELVANQPLWMVRDLRGRVRVVLGEEPKEGTEAAAALKRLVDRLAQTLGAHAYAPERAVLAAGDLAEATAKTQGRRRLEVPGLEVYLLDQQVTGQEWATVSAVEAEDGAPERVTLYSIKGGVGRTTTAAVMATHLAGQGHRVLLLDLDVEAPGLSTALLSLDEQPELGVVDWFVEDAVGQGDSVLRSMVARSALARDLPGEILVVPAHGHEAGEYLAKLGRLHFDLPPGAHHEEPERWTRRLTRLLRALEQEHAPDVTVLDSRSGLHDVAAALVTDIRAFVLLFAAGSEQTFSAYKLLFRYWLDHGTAELIRERIKMVSAMVPELKPQEHIGSFREASWDIFREHLYDQVDVPGDGEAFSFDLNDADGPHDPLPIYWSRGLASLPSLRDLEEPSLEAAYGRFLPGLDRLLSPPKRGRLS